MITERRMRGVNIPHDPVGDSGRRGRGLQSSRTRRITLGRHAALRTRRGCHHWMTRRHLLLATVGLVVLATITSTATWFMHRHPFGLEAHYYRGSEPSNTRPLTLSHPIVT